MDNNALGKAIRKARGDLSLRDYAKKNGISHTHLDSIEKGYDPRTGKPVTISLDTFVKLSDATGIPLEELLFMLKYNLNDLEAIEEKPATSRTPIEGKALGGQRVLGYKVNSDCYFEIDETTAPVVVDIFKLYSSGKTVKEICDILNARGVKTARGGAFNKIACILS